MKKFLFVLALIIIPGYALDTQVNTNIFGGLALAVGDGSDYMNPGISVCIEPVAKLAGVYSLGGHIDYTWLSVDAGGRDLRAGIHVWQLGFVEKLHYNISDDFNVYAEFDPEMCFVLGYMRSDFGDDSDFEARFGLTMGTGVNYKKLLFVFKYKIVFTEYTNTKWITFNIGFTPK